MGLGIERAGDESKSYERRKHIGVSCHTMGMDRRTLLRASAIGTLASCAGCVSPNDIPIVGNPATAVREADQAGNLTGYDELDCDVSQDESLATPVSAMEFGAGDGEHWVYLLVDTQEPSTASIEVSVRSELIFEESVELGGNRYTSYEFTYPASYSLSVTLNGNEMELPVKEDLIGASPEGDMRVSGQTFCLTMDGDFEEQLW